MLEHRSLLNKLTLGAFTYLVLEKYNGKPLIQYRIILLWMARPSYKEIAPPTI
jgi:hypothetical protein